VLVVIDLLDLVPAPDAPISMPPKSFTMEDLLFDSAAGSQSGAQSGGNSPTMSVAGLSPNTPRRQGNYWSVSEKETFVQALVHHGRDWEAVSMRIGSKTAPQSRNFFANYRHKLGFDAMLEEHGHGPSDVRSQGSVSRRSFTEQGNGVKTNEQPAFGASGVEEPAFGGSSVEQPAFGGSSAEQQRQPRQPSFGHLASTVSSSTFPPDGSLLPKIGGGIRFGPGGFNFGRGDVRFPASDFRPAPVDRNDFLPASISKFRSSGDGVRLPGIGNLLSGRASSVGLETVRNEETEERGLRSAPIDGQFEIPDVFGERVFGEVGEEGLAVVETAVGAVGVEEATVGVGRGFVVVSTAVETVSVSAPIIDEASVVEEPFADKDMMQIDVPGTVNVDIPKVVGQKSPMNIRLKMSDVRGEGSPVTPGDVVMGNPIEELNVDPVEEKMVDPAEAVEPVHLDTVESVQHVQAPVEEMKVDPVEAVEHVQIDPVEAAPSMQVEADPVEAIQPVQMDLIEGVQESSEEMMVDPVEAVQDEREQESEEMKAEPAEALPKEGALESSDEMKVVIREGVQIEEGPESGKFRKGDRNSFEDGEVDE
jgi:hypothetical protein